MNLNYNNITISGGVAVGKNTLLDNLRPILEPEGWHFTSGGKILRDFTKEYVQPLASLADDDFHKKLDERTMNLLEEGHYVVEDKRLFERVLTTRPYEKPLQFSRRKMRQ